MKKKYSVLQLVKQTKPRSHNPTQAHKNTKRSLLERGIKKAEREDND